MRSYLRRIDKYHVWMGYSVVIEDTQDYEKTTRYEMFDEAQDLIRSNPQLLEDILTEEEMDQAIKLAYRDEPIFLHYGDSIIRTTPLLFIFEHLEARGKDSVFKMIPEISLFLKNFEKSESYHEKKAYEFIVKGMIDFYGIIYFSDINYLYQTLRKEKHKKYPPLLIEDFDHLTSRLHLRSYTCYRDCFVHELIDDEVVDFKPIKNRRAFDLETYYEMGYYGYPISRFKTELQEKIQTNKTANVHLFMQTLVNPQNFLIELEFFQSGYINTFLETIKDDLDTWPLWNYGGKSIQEIYDGVGTIDKDKQNEFLNFMKTLTNFGNHKYRIIPKKLSYTEEEALNIIEEIVKRKLDVNEFKKSRFYPHDKNSEEFINGFKHAIHIELGYAISYLEGKLLVLKDDVIYHVAGITHSIEENISEIQLPIMVSMILIPLKDSITYTVSMMSMPSVSMGPGMIDFLQNDFKSAKHAHKLSDIV